MQQAQHVPLPVQSFTHEFQIRLELDLNTRHRSDTGPMITAVRMPEATRYSYVHAYASTFCGAWAWPWALLIGTVKRTTTCGVLSPARLGSTHRLMNLRATS
eukprot:4587709-Pleurochrysis_carterae.AAC.1